MENTNVTKSKEEVDLGVTITKGLTPDRHIDRITGEVTKEPAEENQNGLFMYGW